MKRLPFIISVLFIAALAGPLPGQLKYRPGDVVMGVLDTHFRLAVVPPAATLVRPSVVLPNFPSPGGMHLRPSHDNRSLWYATGWGAGSGVFSITPFGVISTVVPTGVTIAPTQMLVDGNGDLYIADVWGCLLRHSQGKTTTLYGGLRGGVYGLAVDLDDGSILLANADNVARLSVHGPPSLSVLRYDTSSTGPPIGIRHDPETGYLLETRRGQITRYDKGRQRFVTPSPALPHPVGGLGDVFRDSTTGLFLVTGNDAPTGTILFTYDARQNVITGVSVVSHGNKVLFGGTATVAATRHLATLAPVRPGDTLRLRVSDTWSAGRPYQVALSFGYRPGIRVGGRRIPLKPDALFFLSLWLKSMFRNFSGLLDGSGEAIATVQVPNHPSFSGLRVYAAAMTPTAVSDPVVVTIQ